MDTILPRIRRSSVAGYCYPEEPSALKSALRGYCIEECQKDRALGVILPYGSLEQSGAVTGATLSRIEIPSRCIVIGPRYFSQGPAWSVLARGAYETPLGSVPVDEALVDALRVRCSWLEPDPTAHAGEHAIEAFLPFLQLLGPNDLRIVPILTSSEREADFSQMAGALSAVLQQSTKPVLLIASSFLSQYEEVGQGAEKDLRILGHITAFDGVALLRSLREEGTIMHGCGAVVSVLMALNRSGLGRAEVVRYTQRLAGGVDPESAIGCGGIILR